MADWRNPKTEMPALEQRVIVLISSQPYAGFTKIREAYRSKWDDGTESWFGYDQGWEVYGVVGWMPRPDDPEWVEVKNG